MERDARAVREDPVHREPRAVEVVARRREDDEMEARRRLVALAVHVGPCAPEERVVERVEVRPLRHRRALRIEDSVVPGHVCLQAGGRLHDRAVPDGVELLGVLLDGLGAVRVLCVLGNRLRPLLHVEPRLERRRHALGEVEVQVPRLDVLEEMREMHRRSSEEVAVGKLVGVSGQRLEVRDPRRAEPGLLRRREAEEELSRVGDELGAADPRRHRHLLRQALAPVEAAAGEAPADARDREEPFRLVEEARRPVGDEIHAVAPQEDGDVVVLEDQVLRVAREADRVDDAADLLARRLRRADVHRELLLRQGGDVAREVGKPPAEADRQPLRRGLVARVELLQRLAQRRAGLGQCGGGRLHVQPGGDDLVVERRHDDLDPVVDDHLRPAEDVLLGRENARALALGRGGEAVDELVDPRCAERRRAARDELPPGQAHVRTAAARSSRGRP